MPALASQTRQFRATLLPAHGRIPLVTPRRWLLVALSFAAVIGVSIYLVVTSWPEGGPPIQLPVTAHLLALGAVAAEVFTRALKIKLAARSLGIPIRLSTSSRMSLAGDFGGSITPARSGAEPARFFVLAQAGIKPVNALIILFCELFLSMLSLAIIAVAGTFVFREQGAIVGGLVGVVGAYASFLLGTATAGMLLSRHNASGPPPKWVKSVGFHAGHWRTVQRSLRQLRAGVAAMRKARPFPLFLSLLMAVANVMLRLSLLPILVLYMAPEVSLAPLVLWPMVLLYGGAVAPAPGGGGLIEVAFKATLGGVIPAAAFVTALVWCRFYTFYVYVLLGALATGGTVMRALRREAPVTSAPRVPEVHAGV